MDDSGGPGASPYAMQERRFDHSHPNNLAFMADIRQLLDRYGAVALGEIGSDNSQQALVELVEYTRGENRLHMAYSFDFMGHDCSPAFLHKTLTAPRPVAEQGWLCLAFGNHDVRRVAAAGRTAPRTPPRPGYSTCCSAAWARCASTKATSSACRGRCPYERLQDPYGLNFWRTFKGRDGCRTPMPWRADASPQRRLLHRRTVAARGRPPLPNRHGSTARSRRPPWHACAPS